MSEIIMTTEFTRTSTSSAPSSRSGQLGVPWLTVLPLAAAMAYADGFWMLSLRGAVGAIERTQQPFSSWLRESTLLLPLFVLAVLGALTLALRRFGPELTSTKMVVASGFLVALAGTTVGVGAIVASDSPTSASEAHRAT